MRFASVVVLGSAALIVSVGACGGGAGASGGSAAAARAEPKSPKTACADAKPLAVSMAPERSPPVAHGALARTLADEKRPDTDVAASKAKDKEHSMADLKALEASEEWRELVMHLDDVPPARRDAAWEAMLDRAAPEFMAQTTREKDPFEGFYVAMHLVDRYPRLTKNRAFMERRLEVSKPALKECFAQSHRGGRCLEAAKELVATDPDPAASFQIAKVVRLGQNANVAIPFFLKGLEGRSAAATECGDEDLRLSVLSALALPPDYDNAKVGREVAAGVCFEKLRPAIEHDLQEGSSYYADNACSVLKAKSTL